MKRPRFFESLTAALLTVLIGALLAAPAMAQGNSGKNKDNDDSDDEPDLPPVQYTFELLGTFGGISWAFDMNSYGEIVGTSQIEGTTERDDFPDAEDERRAFLSTPGGDFISLYDLLSEEDQESWIRLGAADTINDHGQITGQGLRWIDEDKTGWEPRKFLLTFVFDDNGEYVAMIEEFPVRVERMNADGLATGIYEFEEGDRAFLLTDDWSMKNLGVLYDYHNFSKGMAINAWGDIAGFSGEQGEEFRAFFYSESDGMLDLGVFQKERGGFEQSFAYDLNDLGEVVGTASAGARSRHAFRFRDGALEDLGTFGGDRSVGRGINNYGEVVGRAQDEDGTYHAFLYIDGSGMVKLEDLIENLPEGFPLADPFIETMRINDAGEIMGNGGRDGDGGILEAYRLTPISVTE